MSGKKYLIVVISAILLASMAVPAAAQLLRPGALVENFIAYDQNGALVSLQGLGRAPTGPQGQGGQARIVVLTFLVSDCKPCQEVNANWAALLAKWNSSNIGYGFAQMLVQGKGGKPSKREDAQDWAKRSTVPRLPVLFETAERDLEQLVGLRGFGITTYPTFVVIGADQRVRAVLRNATFADLDAAVRATQPKRGLGTKLGR